MARTRLARLPNPLANSALYRAARDSKEKFPSCPNCTSRMR